VVMEREGSGIEEIVAGLEAAHQEMADALAGLSAEQLEQALGPNQWRVRDLFAHVNHWNRWGYNRMRYVMKHGDWPPRGPGIDTGAANRRVVDARALHPVGDVLAEFEIYHDDVIAFLRSLPPEWAERSFEFGGRQTNLKAWFSYPADHARRHAQDARAWRATLA
jgi:DinB superfamily